MHEPFQETFKMFRHEFFKSPTYHPDKYQDRGAQHVKRNEPNVHGEVNDVVRVAGILPFFP